MVEITFNRPISPDSVGPNAPSIFIERDAGQAGTKPRLGVDLQVASNVVRVVLRDPTAFTPSKYILNCLGTPVGAGGRDSDRESGGRPVGARRRLRQSIGRKLRAAIHSGVIQPWWSSCGATRRGRRPWRSSCGATRRGRRPWRSSCGATAAVASLGGHPAARSPRSPALAVILRRDSPRSSALAVILRRPERKRRGAERIAIPPRQFRFSTQSSFDVAPSRILTLDERDLPRPAQELELLLASDCDARFFEHFDMDKPIHIVPLSKAADEMMLVLTNTSP